MNEKPTAVISGASLGALRNAREHRDDQRHHQAPDQPQRPGRERQADRPVQPRGDERADHENVAVGEVDQLDDPVDERVADGDERPDGAVREPVEQVVAEPAQVALVLEVLNAVDHGHD
jgi:hypothetical protein